MQLRLTQADAKNLYMTLHGNVGFDFMETWATECRRVYSEKCLHFGSREEGWCGGKENNLLTDLRVFPIYNLFLFPALIDRGYSLCPYDAKISRTKTAVAASPLLRENKHNIINSLPLFDSRNIKLPLMVLFKRHQDRPETNGHCQNDFHLGHFSA